MTRKRHTQSVLFAVLAVLPTFATAVHAGDPPVTGNGQAATEQAPSEARPVTPPRQPGLTIVPSPFSPPAAESQTEGCPVRSLKPLELLV
jgi:hypothetical protein